MKKKEQILIVEDEFIVANDLRLTLKGAGYEVCAIASSVERARKILDTKEVHWVLLDIMLNGNETGIDLAVSLREKNIPFVYISANTNQSILEAANATQPYGFLVKPFRERDLLVMMDIAHYRYQLENDQVPATTASLQAPAAPVVEGIVGDSTALKNVLRQLSVVAPADTSVLILGESGTGKESIATGIHTTSRRSAGPMIKVNCAALPESLIESELFGHERGAFTGANNRRIGKFEQANGGTIFLDEIGEMSLDAQVKLLRVLQEKEIERLGGDTTIKVDVRVVAATNRHIEKEVAEGRFRLDLYYRLNIFPIIVPPLRDRKEDIEALVKHFIKRYARELKKPEATVTDAAMQQMKAYSWPGNIRQLQHTIERSVLLAFDNVIDTVDLPESPAPALPQPSGPFRTLEEMEKEHIVNALKMCGGRVFGPGGAAELLNIPTSTLYSKMKKLDIKQGYH